MRTATFTRITGRRWAGEGINSDNGIRLPAECVSMKNITEDFQGSLLNNLETLQGAVGRSLILLVKDFDFKFQNILENRYGVNSCPFILKDCVLSSKILSGIGFPYFHHLQTSLAFVPFLHTLT